MIALDPTIAALAPINLQESIVGTPLAPRSGAKRAECAGAPA
jgi:hypothetical protein